MKLQVQSDNSVTLIDNSFIDRFMSGANGEFVKLYLYLLRCVGAGAELSVSSIADFFDHTEKDVKRALSYWEKQGVLRLSYGEDGSISEILLYHGEEMGRDRCAAPAGPGTDALSSGREDEQPAIPSRSSLSASRRKELKEQEEIRQLVFVAETYFGRVLTSTELNNILYFYDTLAFSSELIEYLLEYCASKGNPGPKYMEKVALGWYREGITTVAQAKRQSSQYNRDYYEIFNALGIKGRSPVAREVEYMDRWLRQWGFPMDVILEACARTVLQSHQSSFSYADSILKSWHEQGVTSMEDIEKQDEAHRQAAGEKGKVVRLPGAGKSNAGRGSTANRFNNFRQRDYDYDELERELLQAQLTQNAE